MTSVSSRSHASTRGEEVEEIDDAVVTDEGLAADVAGESADTAQDSAESGDGGEKT